MYSFHRHLVSIVAVTALLGSSLSIPARAAGELWDDNDYILADFDALVILDENFNFKAVKPTNVASEPGDLTGHGFGSLDWFANGDVLLSLRQFTTGDIGSLRYNRNGVQLGFFSSLDGGQMRAADIKVSFTQTDIIVGTLVGNPAVRRFILGGAGQESASLDISSYGGVAVVPKADGSHEVWMAAEGEVGGMHIFPMEASGVARFDQPTFTFVEAGSSTMSYDPNTRRVLFSNLSDGQILAMDVETRQVVKTYTIPSDQKPPNVQFTGITAGSNGIVIGVESFDYFLLNQPAPRRVGLSVWDADGSNYRFINLDDLPGYDLFEGPFGGRAPINILWTGNSPEFRSAAPSIACPGAVVLACATAAGRSQDITAAVTDPDSGQTLTVSLREGAAALQAPQTLATPAANTAVTFDGVLFLPGEHPLTVEVSDGPATSSCNTHVTVQQDTTAPAITGVPGPITVTATSQSGAPVSYAPPVANDACAGSVPVSCAPASGSTFPIGTTPVNCTASDAANNSGTATFQVTVDPPPPLPTLSALVTGKTGAQNGRIWTMALSNSGPGSAVQAQIDGLTLTQTSGAACAPVITNSFPLSVGNIGPQGSATGQVTINFGGCAAAAKFTATIPYSSNSGAVNGSKTLYNQFR